MDYNSLCRDKHETEVLRKLTQSAECDYANNHYLYRQAAQYALAVFKDMLFNRSNDG
jgi:hypothetical protein